MERSDAVQKRRRRRRRRTPEAALQRLLLRRPLPTYEPVTPNQETDEPNQETDEQKWEPLSAWEVAAYTTTLFIFCLVYFIRCVTAIAEQMGL